MKYLLDTHIFLWLNNSPEKLSKTALDICSNFESELYLSYVTPWEVQIKTQLGNLKIKQPIRKMIKVQQEENNMQLLSIQLNHIENLNNLPQIHRDPFDRLLIAQALSEELTLISADKKIKQYDIEVIS